MAGAWPGGFMERCQRQHADLRGALVEEVRRLAMGRTHEPVPENAGVAFTRSKVEPMVRGLFSKVEQDVVLATLEKSVVYVTSETIEPLLLSHSWDRSAWDPRESVPAERWREAARQGRPAPRRDQRGGDLLRLARVLCRGRPVRRLHRSRGGAHLSQLQAPHDRAPRDAHEGVAARHRVPAARDVRVLVRGIRLHRRPREEPGRASGAGRRLRLRAPHLRGARGPSEVASIVVEAASARSGWKVILARCAPTTKPRSALQVAREAIAARDLADGV